MKMMLLAILLLATLSISACKPVTPATQQNSPPVPTSPAANPPEPAPAPPSPPAPTTSPAGPAPIPPSPVVQPAPPTTTVPPPAPVITRGFNIGERAIDFELQTLDGQTVKLSNLRGQPVLINFWATWCGPCKAEMPFLQQVDDKWSSKGLVLLAIDLIGSTRTETPETVKKFMTEFNLSMKVPLDEGLKVTKAYAITGIPTTFLIDKDGIIRYKRVGAFPNVAAIESELPKIMP